MGKKRVYPVIGDTGSGRAKLRERHGNAAMSLSRALSAMRDAEPRSVDYDDRKSFKKACKQFGKSFKAVTAAETFHYRVNDMMTTRLDEE